MRETLCITACMLLLAAASSNDRISWGSSFAIIAPADEDCAEILISNQPQDDGSGPTQPLTSSNGITAYVRVTVVAEGEGRENAPDHVIIEVPEGYFAEPPVLWVPERSVGSVMVCPMEKAAIG